ncbi:AraC family transcriptional regulator [Streptomyces sp. NPDC048179]|uniref:helix-turn-helix transcriptional regulator n=1 Tax=Streptomyces sp. NPDC048179 TaxID=3365506 RepID=UPI003710E8A2
MTVQLVQPTTEAGILARFSLVRSTDPQEFVAAINATYPYGQVTASDSPHRPQTYELRALTGPDYTVGYLRSGLGVTISPRRDGESYYLNLAPSGTVLSRVGRYEIANSPDMAVVVPPRTVQHLAPVRAGTESIGIRLDRQLVEAELTSLLGSAPVQPVDFHPGLDLTQPGGRSIAALVQNLLLEADRPGGAFEHPWVQRQYIRTLVVCLLTSHPHNYTEALSGRERPPTRPRTLRRALEYIDTHIDQPLTVADLAQAAGCSPRTLHEQFHAVLGSSPMGHVREARLQGAHRDLCDGVGSVTEVACAWGFSHLGRFSSSYRLRFGCLPSETARGSSQQ